MNHCRMVASWGFSIPLLPKQTPTTSVQDPQRIPHYPSLRLNPHPTPSPEPSPLGCWRAALPFPPLQTESTALGMLGRPSKKRFNMLLSACLPRASDVCALRDTPALCSPPSPPFPIPVSRFKPTLLLFPYFLGRKGHRIVSPSLSQRQKSPLPAQKEGTGHPSSTPRASP